MENEIRSKLKHDIQSDLSALINSLELLHQHFENDPELVDQIMPLFSKKHQSFIEKWIQYRELKSHQAAPSPLGKNN